MNEAELQAIQERYEWLITCIGNNGHPLANLVYEDVPRMIARIRELEARLEDERSV